MMDSDGQSSRSEARQSESVKRRKTPLIIEPDEVKVMPLYSVMVKAWSFSPMSVLITDNMIEDNPIIYANPAFYKPTGFSEDETLGRNCRFLQGDESVPEQAEHIRKTLELGSVFQGVLLNYKRDGSSFWNRLTIGPMMNEAGDITHYVGFQEDVTDRK